MELQEINQRYEAAIEELTRHRDELRLQIHLASAETKSEWERLEQKWKELQRKRVSLKSAAREAATEIRAALELLLTELKNGYQKIAEALR